MKTAHFFFTVLVISLTTAACSDYSSRPHSSPYTEIEGQWLGACVANPDTGTSSYLNVTVSGHSLTRNYALFNKSTTCDDKSLAMSINSTASFLLDTINEANLTDGSKRIRYTEGLFSVNLASAEMVSEYNSATECGKSDWSVNSPLLANGMPCTTFKSAALGAITFGKYKIENNKLYLRALNADLQVRDRPESPINFDNIVVEKKP